MRAWLVALGGCAAVLLVAWCVAAPGTERAVSASSVYVAGAGRAIQGGTAQAGGWGRGGGYPMMPGPAADPVNGGGGAVSGGTAAAASANWAGYAVTGTPGTFTSVSGSWTQPAVTCGAANAFSSFWAGLDGDGTPTVEQTGTEADCSNGAATYAGWYEMFPSAPVLYDNPVQPGDSMSASVVAADGAFTLTLTDATQGWTQTTQQASATAQLGSAEVITEAPGNGTVLPLANFGTVNFTNAIVGNTIIGNADPAALTIVSGGITEATPSALTGGNSFTVTRDSSGSAASPPATAPSPGANMTSPSSSPAGPVTASAAP